MRIDLTTEDGRYVTLTGDDITLEEVREAVKPPEFSDADIRRVLELARDGRRVPGVYHACARYMQFHKLIIFRDWRAHLTRQGAGRLAALTKADSAG
jgi:hypothetical protein